MRFDLGTGFDFRTTANRCISFPELRITNHEAQPMLGAGLDQETERVA